MHRTPQPLADAGLPGQTAASQSRGDAGLEGNLGNLVPAVSILRRKSIGQRPALSECQPEPDHVTSPLRLRPIIKTRTGVKDRQIVAKLHIAELQVHIQMDLRVVRQAVEEI